MKKELDDKLCKKYPTIFKDRYGDKKETCMCWGFSHGDGWYKIIDELCTKLELIKEVTGIKIIADQVKEKFGTLRFYYHIEVSKRKKKLDDSWYYIIRDVIHYAENQSAGICEVCGSWSEIRKTTGWVYNMCDKCWTKFKKKRGIVEEGDKKKEKKK